MAKYVLIRITKTPRGGPPDESLRATWVGLTLRAQPATLETSPPPNHGFKVEQRGALMQLVRLSIPAFSWYQFQIQALPRKKRYIFFFADEVELLTQEIS